MSAPDNRSLAAQAVADAGTLAPPSFDGHGWLVVINLATMSAATLIAAMVVGLLLSQAWSARRADRGWAPARLWRIAGLCFSIGMVLRCGAGALELWGWNPHDPVTTGRFLLWKRAIDPVAVAFGLTGLSVFTLSAPGIVWQLRREPFPVDLWQSWPIVRRMLAVVTLSLIAAIGVVSTR